MKLETLAQSASAQLIPGRAPDSEPGTRNSELRTQNSENSEPGIRNPEITGVTCDSRRVQRGDLFAALPGVKIDGRVFARQAAERGAAAILCQTAEPLTDLPQLVCTDARMGLAHAARAFYGWPDKRMKMGAVTGTNGKSTTAYLVRHLLNTCGLRCGMLGTIEYDLGEREGKIEAPLTTPESLDLHRYLRAMADSGCAAAFMETSSHSLSQHRVAGIEFAVAVFTNLTQDHLDYHRTMDEYRDAKANLFRNLSPDAVAVVNIDDPASAYFTSLTPARLLGFSLKRGDLVGRIRGMDIHGTHFEISSPWGKRKVSWKLVGAHNVQNCLGAVAAAVSMGAKFDDVIAALSSFEGVPGRLESVGEGEGEGGRVGEPLPFRVLIDYAHTDDALRSVMRALRELKPSRLIAVFGCGGDRDRTKRPKMARAVEEMADLGVITSDNPRTEDPQAIIADVWAGVHNQQKFIVEPDRAKAIDLAIREARSGDVVLIAGKGHENYQIFGTEKRHFSDVEEATGAIARRQSVPSSGF